MLAGATADDVHDSEYSYSNLGMAVLGDAIASDHKASYEEVLTEHILGPLGMDDTVLAAIDSELPMERAVGREAATARATEPWLAEGWQPAGMGVWSTATDLASLVDALLDGSAPGQAAIDPRFEAGPDRMIGFGWFTRSIDGTSVTYHNGGTGGFRSWVGLSPDSERGLIVLSNTSRSVDHLGEHLLVERSGPLEGRSIPLIGWLMVIFAIAGTGWSTVAAFGGLGGGNDRQALIGTVASAVAVLAVTRVLGPWDQLSTAPWALGMALTAAALLGAILRWPTLPTSISAYPRARWLSTGFGVAIAFVSIFLAW